MERIEWRMNRKISIILRMSIKGEWIKTESRREDELRTDGKRMIDKERLERNFRKRTDGKTMYRKRM